MLWEVLTASSLLPPTAEEVLMEEDFKEMGEKSSMDVYISNVSQANKSVCTLYFTIAILKCIKL